MTPSINSILVGDCRDVMALYPDNFFHSVICDPPYELAFMGRSWDHSGIAYDLEVWGQCLRVLKPGGHLLSFGSTRTYHRMVCAIEDAGFEIRDCIEYVYGSGFPKSLDISKQIDKRGGQSIGWFGPWLRQWREENNITQKDIAALFPSKTGGLTGCVANWELNLNMPTCEQFNLICKTYNLPFDSLEEAEREIIGKNPNGFGPNKGASLTHNLAAHPDITAPSTDAAKQWAGWGSALKPSHESIVLARKPISEKTIAENVLRWGTGALNIDACRVDLNGISKDTGNPNRIGNKGNNTPFDTSKSYDPTQKRFPANLIHDSSPEVMAEFAKAGDRKVGHFNGHRNLPKTKNDYGKFDLRDEQPTREESNGSAARFFQSCPFTEEDYNIPAFVYDEKAPSIERLSHCRICGEVFGCDRKYHKHDRKDFEHISGHPTQKPLSLMRYLCRLVTPPNGLILDPFAGSGTTCLAAKKEGFRYVGIELQQEYVDIAKARLKAIPERLDRWAVYEKEDSKAGGDGKV